jgi:hypothetical protein
VDGGTAGGVVTLESIPSKDILSFLKPGVLTFARLLLMISIRFMAARLPDNAEYMPLFMMVPL